jgi:hypothetical protein
VTESKTKVDTKSWAGPRRADPAAFLNFHILFQATKREADEPISWKQSTRTATSHRGQPGN